LEEDLSFRKEFLISFLRTLKIFFAFDISQEKEAEGTKKRLEIYDK